VVPFSYVAPQMPAISVDATQATASEYGENRTLIFTFTRTGQTTEPLTVAYSTGGTAQQGIDFVALPGIVTIPAGASSAQVLVEIRSDSSSEGPETVTLSLINGAEYSTRAPVSASGTITDRPLQAYLHAKGLTTADADDDGDGLSNILEYYLGTSGNDVASRASLTAIQGSDGSFSARFPHAKEAIDLSAAVEWSTDMINWQRTGESDGQRTAAITTRVVSPEAEDPETIEAVLTITEGPVPSGVFLRLAVAP